MDEDITHSALAAAIALVTTLLARETLLSPGWRFAFPRAVTALEAR